MTLTCRRTSRQQPHVSELLSWIYRDSFLYHSNPFTDFGTSESLITLRTQDERPPFHRRQDHRLSTHFQSLPVRASHDPPNSQSRTSPSHYVPQTIYRSLRWQNLPRRWSDVYKHRHWPICDAQQDRFVLHGRMRLHLVGHKERLHYAIPGRDHVIEHAIHPMNSPNKRANTERWSKHMPLLALAGLAGFENGQTYKIGVSDEAVVNEWIEGTIWEILGWQMLGWTPEGKREKIEYTVIEAASLKVRRDKADEPVEEPWPEPAKLNTAEQTMPALTLPVKYQRPEDCAEELSEQSRRCLENRGRHGSVHSVPSSYHGFASRIFRAATKHYIKKSFNIVD
jgi:hypothetical protein